MHAVSDDPLRVSIANDLRRRVQRGEWGPGGRLPTRTKLAAQYQCGRTTMTEAMNTLLDEGTIHVRRGDGTFAGPPVRERRPIGMFSEATR